MPTVDELEGWGARLGAMIDALPAEGVQEDAILHGLTQAAHAYEGAVESKVDGIVRVLQVIEDREQIARRDKARADAAIRYHRRQAQRVRRLARALLISHEATTARRKVATVHATVSLTRRTEYAYPEDLEAWPAEWVREEIRHRPDRAMAREAIEAGEAPHGFGSVEVDAIQVRGRKS